MEKHTLDKNIRLNAMMSYCWLAFLFLILPEKMIAQNNKFIKHPFIMHHSKKAAMIHLLFIFTYIVFISFWLGIQIRIFHLTLNTILASILCTILFLMLLKNIWEAYHGKTGSMFHLPFNTQMHLKLWYETEQKSYKEQDIFLYWVTLIPFVSLLFSWSAYSKKTYIANNIKASTLFSFIWVTFYVHHFSNIAMLLLLVYSVFSVFLVTSVLLHNQMFLLKLESIPSLKDLYQLLSTTICYSKQYFQKHASITPWKEVHHSLLQAQAQEKHIFEMSLPELPPPRIIHKVGFLPLINLIGIIDVHSQYKFHVINGVGMSMVFCVLLFLFPQYLIYTSFFIILAWSYKHQPYYKMPFIFFIGNIFITLYEKIHTKMHKGKTYVTEKMKEEDEILYK